MNRLVTEIAAFIEHRTRGIVGSLADSDAELRSVFHGPPILYLRAVLSQLSKKGGIECELRNGEKVICPVLLPLDANEGGSGALYVGASGTCTRDHLIALRNTPQGKQWIALAAPGTHNAKSVTGATDEFGVLPVNNGGASSISEWFHDRFVEALLGKAIKSIKWADEAEPKAARILAERAAHAAAAAEHHDPQRTRAWALLSRLLSIVQGELSVQSQWSLACGVPPCADGSLDHDMQHHVLDEVVELVVAGGFGTCADKLKTNASPSESVAVDEMIAHLRRNADITIAIAHGVESYYAPSTGDSLLPAPAWWTILTADRLRDLLGVDRPRPETFGIKVLDLLQRPGLGLPNVVASEVRLLVSLPADERGPVDVTVAREGAGRGNAAEWRTRVDVPKELTDSMVPKHTGALRYVAIAEGYKKAAVRVVVLDEFVPGVVIASRSATKLALPKKTKAGSHSHLYECVVVLSGQGRHFLELHVARGHRLGDSAEGEDTTTSGAEPLSAAISPPADGGEGPWGLEVLATAECYYDIPIHGPEGDFVVRLLISCEDATAEGCRSEFERLIRLNRSGEAVKAVHEVQIDRQVRTTDLQSWLLEDPDRSFYPLVIASDCRQAWRAPNWTTAAGTVLSEGQFIHDPRPRPDEFAPPQNFLDARREIARRIRGEDGHGVVEAAELGSWMAHEDFVEVVDSYVRSYRAWLESDPDTASWIDTVMVTSVEADGALSQEPIAVLVNPMHPLRLGWHALAQRALYDSYRSSCPCPAASILDPDGVPDALSLPLRTASGGIRSVLFLSTDSSSDYWSVLWSATQLSSLAARGANAPFDREFGLQVGGIASGFSVSQVQRAMDDVSLLFTAKPVLNVLVTSATANGSACNDGLMDWARSQFAPGPETSSRLPRMGSQLLQVFDERRMSARPEDAEIANLTEDTGGSVKWFAGTPKDSRPDLGIIAQLETSNASANTTSSGSPLGRGALLRHRIRTQLQAGGGAFLSESRMGVAGPPSGDALADHVAALTARIENLAELRLGYTFAPSIKTVQSVLRDKSAEYVAVSSSAVDPACFLGGWLEDAYLWDYELPSYSNRSGDTSGYYLLSRVRHLDSDALLAVLARLPGCADLGEDAVKDILLEVARRGIPTVRGLSAGHTGASGDLGLFLAGRLLQDAFRVDARQDGLLPLIKSDGDAFEVVLAVPVDPFRGYLTDLQKAIGQPTLRRPDILMFGLSITPSRVAIRLTPIEVKWRQQALSVSSANDALAQARALSALVTGLQKQGNDPGMSLWRLAYQHLLLSMLDFGFRVYSQREVVRQDPQDWTALHERVAAAILGETAEVEVDGAGRLVVFDATAESTHIDLDMDGLCETIVISPSDAARIVLDQSADLYAKVRAAVGDWSVLPVSIPRVVARPAKVKEPPAAAPGDADDARHVEPASNVDGVVVPGLSGYVATGSVAIAAAAGYVEAEIQQVRPVVSAQNGTDVAHTHPVDLLPSVGEHSGGTQDVALVSDSLKAGNDRGIVVRVGTMIDGFRSGSQVYLPSVTDVTQLNIGVVGDLGTGKTQLIQSLVYQIRSDAAANNGVSPRFLIFDYKKDYQSPDFVNAVGAKVVEPFQLPINLFDTTGVMRSPAWFPRFQFFADVLDKIYSNIGPVQRSNLSKSVKAAHEAATAHGRASTIYDVEKHYEVAVRGRMDSLLSILNDLTISELFTRTPSGGASFDSFFDGVVVISLAALGQDDRTKNLLVAIFLNLFYEFMLRLPKRPYRGNSPQLRTVDSYLLVDEADNIMKYEFDVLKSVLLQGREFGVGVLLASQYLKHFKVGATDYREPLLTWFIHKVPDLRPQELEKLGMTSNLVQLVERVKHLPKHHCLYKTFDVSGEVLTGLPFYKLLTEETS